MKFVHQIRNRHFFVFDLLMIGLAVYLSYIMRLETFTFGDGTYWANSVIFTLFALILMPITFWTFGLYSRYWRYASVDELVLLALSVFLAAALTSVCAYLYTHLAGILSVPRSIPFIFFMIALALTAAPRLAVRLIASKYAHNVSRPEGKTLVPVVIMGAGDAGDLTLRELRKRPDLGMDVIGFLDDDPQKRGMRIHGVAVLGDRHAIARLATEYHIRTVIIAMPTADGKTIREIVQICEWVGVKTQTIPGIYELLEGTVSVNQIRNVQIEDLLRREPVHTDVAAVRELLHGQRVLVTGGGGSIGGELCHQVLRCHPEALIVVGHGENSVFTIQHELQKHLPAGTQLHGIIADTRDAQRIHDIFEAYRPQVVFHAAAHKHVPLMELNPSEAITTNVQGTRNVLNAAQAVGVSHFVMISSDKAVNPTSIMGASKRAAELLVHDAAIRSQKPYVTVRFGNVLGSRGSVILTFKQQIAAGGPVTVTHPDMKRFFMTIPEAVQLVLQAAVLGKHGEVFVLDMGEPVKISDLAHDLIKLSGPKSEREVKIQYTGIRPGEKLYEELFIPGEDYKRTEHAKVFIASHASAARQEDLEARIDELVEAARLGTRTAIVDRFKALIPEYSPFNLDMSASSSTSETLIVTR